MHNFCLFFGAAMAVFFCIIALASLLCFIGSVISVRQVLILIPACITGAALCSELVDYGYHIRD